jgi:hypothetical protein
VLKKVQIFAIGLRMDQVTTLTVGLKCSDEKAAQALESFVKNQKMEAIKDLKINQNDAWLRLQGQTNSEQIRQAFSRTIGVQKK